MSFLQTGHPRIRSAGQAFFARLPTMKNYNSQLMSINSIDFELPRMNVRQ
jgi:hypothetical protein